ncbi:heavy metal translocating P-type ATPase [Pseudarthrobacter enclensis]|uniref:Heavy metal translocating P-type ATPase n=1 Tax=Pseudarthrobacter enclensis TaxID=993070 RepID=A0ABT9RRU4_9MICC|nr:heavy metal translocating P-type ATPase [Pseudarthrobacter enclensis]MDP9887947.1 heavy metal translocating P-type ATPase [Pseudarthrobacter enclensis]
MRRQPAPPAAASGSPGNSDGQGPAASPLEKGRNFVRRYPVVALTCLMLVAALVLLQSGLGEEARVLASAYAAVIVVVRAAGMLRALREGRWGIDLLALMAIASTVAVGEYLAALVVILMLTGGEALENFAQGRAARELRSLLDRAPRFAHREGASGVLEETPIGDVVPGDVLVVRPSELVPVDGELLSDSASLDESSLTGESLPVERTRGQQLLSGAVNGVAAIRLRAAASAADSQYSRIIALVEEASNSRAPVVRLADRYAVPFTALALAMAVMAWFLSGEALRFAEVLVVATPCPLLIAAPVAFLAGTSQAAHKGIIIKNTRTLEQLAKAQSAVFDKTGTLTSGRPVLDEIRLAPGQGETLGSRKVLQLAASAEQYSSHVLAASVIEAAAAANLDLLPVQQATESATHGVEAVCGGRQVVVGKAGLVRSSSSGFREAAVHSGQLAVHVAVDGRYAGALIMKDPLRGNAVDTLASLRRLGVHNTMLLTGDASATAAHIAEESGIDHVQAECLPEDKVNTVAAIRERPVLMVGDGVNDAPVLAAADVGIAMGAKGATAASESADVVIMLDDLSKVAQAVAIGKRTMAVALVSIWTGIGLSVVLMAIAMTGYIPAVAGALLQELVDLATILNGLRALHGADPKLKSRGLPPA